MSEEPIHIFSMYGLFAYIWVIFRAKVGRYSSTMEHLGVYYGVYLVYIPSSDYVPHIHHIYLILHNIHHIYGIFQYCGKYPVQCWVY